MDQRLYNLWKLITTPAGQQEIIKNFQVMESDAFFEKYGAGNFNNDINLTPYPKRDSYGRISEYLDLLALLQHKDSEKFLKAHKGTPYMFLGWLYLDIKDYQKAMFYIDAALGEDKRNKQKAWLDCPAASFMLLKKNIGNPVADRVQEVISEEINKIIKQFNKEFSGDNYKRLIKKDFVEKFIRMCMFIPEGRTFLSSLYLFILEHKTNLTLLNLKGSKGSIEPFLNNLHRGGLLLESLLKITYRSMEDSTLGEILKDPFVMKDINYKTDESNQSRIGRSIEDILNHLSQIKPKNKHSKWITITHKLRNATSHNLLIPDIFNEQKMGYEYLFRVEMFSLIYIIQAKHLRMIVHS